MNRRDPMSDNRQAGGYTGADREWDETRQASQWQADAARQSGGAGEADANERTDYFRQDRQNEGRHAGDARQDGGEYRYRPGDDDRYGARSESRYGADDQWRAGRERGYRGLSRSGAFLDRGSSSERGYRFSGSRGEGSHAFDASGGNDYSRFTSEDYGGRDFSRGGSGDGGVTGGLHPSNTYRPSFGPGSWGSQRDEYGREPAHGDQGRDHDSWRSYGEQRGFLQRAGDEVASWFGDDDAARRREADHRGRGPSDYTRSDDRIREDINDALTHDWRLDATHIRVAVKDGEVTLDGTVSSRQDKRRAEDLADDVTGARHVQNNLRLTSTSEQTRGTYAASSSGSTTTTASGAAVAGRTTT